APVATGASRSTPEDVAFSGVVAASDVDNASLSYAVVTGPAHGSLAFDGATGAYTYTPDANYNGPDSFSWRASDRSLVSGTVAVAITVTAVNDAPVAVGATATIGGATGSGSTVAATDREGTQP